MFPSFFIVKLFMLASKVIKPDILRGYSHIIQHFKNCCIHQGRSAEVVFNLFGFGSVAPTVDLAARTVMRVTYTGRHGGRRTQ